MTERIRHVLYIFLASPGDLGPERDIAREVVESINRIVGRRLGFSLELLVWEDMSPAFERPQARINRDVDSCDLFVGVLWERWGHPTGAYSSGFEEEFERARRRRLNNGAPDIWVVFKRIDPKKLEDPGDQLKRVLDFRTEQTQRHELLFKEFEASEEWKSRLHEWLLEYVLDMAGRAAAPPLEAAAPEPTAPPEVPEPPSRPADKTREDRAGEQLEDIANRFGAFLGTDEARSKVAGHEPLEEGQVVRLGVLSKALLAQVDGRVLLDAFEANPLYRLRRESQLIPSERHILLRTLIADRGNIIPGWFWLRQWTDPEIGFLLGHLAMHDGNVDVRERTLALLGILGLRPRDHTDAWEELLREVAADESDEVRRALFEYLALVGTDEDSRIVSAGLEDPSSRVRDAAARARFRITLRRRPDEAFGLLVGGVAGADAMLLGETVGAVATELLNRALEGGNVQVRRLAIEELRHRRALSIEAAKSLTRDGSAKIRALAFEELIERGAGVTPDEIEKAFAEQKPPTILGRSEDYVDTDELLAKLYASYPAERLEKEIGDLSTRGLVSYRVWGLKHFNRAADKVRRDLQERYGRLEEETLTKARERFGEGGVAVLRGFWEERPEVREFIRAGYTAAGLKILAEHGEAADAEIGRQYIDAGDYRVKVQAVRIIMRFGIAEDVEKLVPIFAESFGELKELAAKAALRLAPGVNGAVRAVFATGSAKLIALGLQALEKSPWEEAEPLVDDLLESKVEAIRNKAVSYVAKRLEPGKLEEFLDEYLEPPYFYNVVCWLDRLLYSPPPLRRFYEHELQEKLGYQVPGEW